MPSEKLSSSFKPLNLSEAEINAITDFVENALYDPNLNRYVPDALPSGLCFPNADDGTKQDLGWTGN